MKFIRNTLLYGVFLLCFAADAKVRLVLTTALTQSNFEFRQKQYTESFLILGLYGYANPYIIEAVAKGGPTFLDTYSCNVFYATVNNPNLRNLGANEARTMHEGIKYFSFEPEDMILKLTGRYQLLNDSFLRLVEKNELFYDAIVKLSDNGYLLTLGYAMKYTWMVRMFEELNYDAMEKHCICVEYACGEWIKERVREGVMRVMYVDKIGIQCNLNASSTAAGASGIVIH